ncbi:hypothetical protein BC829DRAFT_472766 [Chytridium lagenaria]|nr:hypothetical protein BC829DRAFT_472766 [Chytridium lagenaria]
MWICVTPGCWTNQLDDRMESFFLSETLKYLYLLFDEGNIFNRLHNNFVFTTEGHVLFMPKSARRPETSEAAKKYSLNANVCPKWRFPGEVSVIRPPMPLSEFRKINRLIGLPERVGYEDIPAFSEGICVEESYVSSSVGYDIQVQNYEVTVSAPDNHKMRFFKGLILPVHDGVFLSNLHGAHLTLVMDGSASSFVITKDRLPEAQITLFARLETPPTQATKKLWEFPMSGAQFGPEMEFGEKILTEFIPLISDSGMLGHGCAPYGIDQTDAVFGKTVVVKRGGCVFADKVTVAEEAGAIAVVVISHDETLFPLAPASSTFDSIHSLSIPCFLATKSFEKFLLIDAVATLYLPLNGYIFASPPDILTPEEKVPINLHFSGKPVKNILVVDGGPTAQVDAESKRRQWASQFAMYKELPGRT